MVRDPANVEAYLATKQMPDVVGIGTRDGLAAAAERHTALRRYPLWPRREPHRRPTAPLPSVSVVGRIPSYKRIGTSACSSRR